MNTRQTKHKKQGRRKRLILILIILFVGIIVLPLFSYSLWSNANPEKSCASCHEISPSLESWQNSAHRETDCIECHGSALSNGLHSIKEKSSMLGKHIKGAPVNRDIRLSEDQLIETMSRCKNCHGEEFNKWRSGGHSASYADIFLDEKHNSMEQPYWDCFRCHGMHFEGTIYDLIEPVNNKGPWTMKVKQQASKPVINCMACHEIHSVNNVHVTADSLHNPKAIFYSQKEERLNRNPKAGLYIRADKIYLRADMLPSPEIIQSDSTVKRSSNPLQNICVQCHAPDYMHIAGSQDDKTPTGVHEGLACMACHETHSNDASRSCDQCHPTINNCGLDHKSMNTSYHDPNSPNDIHHISCKACHGKEMK